MPLILLFLLLFATSQAQAGYPSLWTQSQSVTPCELVKSGDATKAFNFVQDTRSIANWPHVDQVWYDCATDLFHWKGPVNGKEMSMSRKQYMKEIWYPYFVWIDLHTSF